MTVYRTAEISNITEISENLNPNFKMKMALIKYFKKVSSSHAIRDTICREGPLMGCKFTQYPP